MVCRFLQSGSLHCARLGIGRRPKNKTEISCTIFLFMARLLNSQEEPSDIGGRGEIATTVEVCSPAVNAVNPFSSLSPAKRSGPHLPFVPFIAKRSRGACRYVLEIGFQALFQIL